MGVSEARKLHIRVKQEEGADAVADRRRDRTVGAAAKAGIGTLPHVVPLFCNALGWPMTEGMNSEPTA